jgi:hypothetical protein
MADTPCRTESKDKRTRTVLIMVSLLAVLWVQAPRFFDKLKMDEDFRTFYWMNKFEDPSLFPNDSLGGHRYTNLHLPGGDVPLFSRSWGYGLLFYGASFLVHPILFVKLLPFLLMAIGVWYSFEFGRCVRDRDTGVMLAIGFILLNLISSTSLSVASGLQRAFSCVLIIALFYHLHRKQYIAASVVTTIDALVYPPVFLLSMAVWGLAILRLERHPDLRLSITKRGLGLLLASFVVGALILYPILLPTFSDALVNDPPKEADEQSPGTTSDSYEHLWEDPNYQADGRKPLFYFFPFIGRAGLVNKTSEAIHLLILFCIGCLIVIARGHRAFDLPREIWLVLWASLIVFGLAWVAIWLTNSFPLYLPSRYTRVGLFMFLSMFVLLNGRDAIDDMVISVQRHRKRLIWLLAGGELLVLVFVILAPSDRTAFNGLVNKWLLVLAGLLLGILGIIALRRPATSVANKSKPGQTKAGQLLFGAIAIVGLVGWGAYAAMITSSSTLNPTQAEREMLAYIETLPKDVLLAGTPCALDNVPLLAKRQILFSCEWISEDPELVIDALDAYYADDAHTVVDFCEAHSIDYLVTDLATYADEYLAQAQIFFEPYNQELLLRIADRDAFVMTRIPDELKVFEAESLFIVPCDERILQ